MILPWTFYLVSSKLGNWQMKAVPWEIFTRDYMFCSPLQFHLHCVNPLGWVCIGVYFSSALVNGDLPLGHYFWYWREILLSLSFCVSILRKETEVGLIVLTFSVKTKGSLQEPITWNKTLPKVVMCSGLILRLRSYSKGHISDKVFFNSSP